MVHLLHVEMLALVRELLSKFMKPGAIPLSVKEILKINVRDAALQLPNKPLCVGKYGYSAMTKARVAKTLWVGNLYNSLREGYMKAAEFLLKNLPLDNHMVTSLSALTPSLIQCDSLGSAFMALGKALPNVVPPEALGPLREEVRAYQIDADLVPLANTYVEENSRVDVDWWSQVALLRNSERGVRYPTLIKLVKALLSIFTGPLVEGSFNIMDDILEADRCRMNVETYESLAIIKSTMKARKWTASTMLIDQPLRNSCLSSYKTYQLHLEKKKAREQGMREKRMSEAMRVRSTAVANRIVTQAKKSKGPSSSSTRPAASPRPTRPSPKTISSAKTRPFRPTGPSTTSSGAAKKPSSSSSGPSASSSGATNKPSASSSGPSASSSGPSASTSGPSAFSSGPSASSSGPSASSSGPSTASSGQPKLFSLFHGPAKKSSSIASTTSGKRKSSDDSEPGKKRKK
ncbi:uncharacterized protein LOC134872551 [Eleginops maclovinus]|uniref:uncharacterized protein LOC134872551 n=1 Tax=Eleginops maclovinus TaxID=56733 RepID=UPI003080A10B